MIKHEQICLCGQTESTQGWPCSHGGCHFVCPICGDECIMTINYEDVDKLCYRFNQLYNNPNSGNIHEISRDELRIIYLALVTSKAQLKDIK